MLHSSKCGNNGVQMLSDISKFFLVPLLGVCCQRRQTWKSQNSRRKCVHLVQWIRVNGSNDLWLTIYFDIIDCAFSIQTLDSFNVLMLLHSTARTHAHLYATGHKKIRYVLTKIIKLCNCIGTKNIQWCLHYCQYRIVFFVDFFYENSHTN